MECKHCSLGVKREVELKTIPSAEGPPFYIKLIECQFDSRFLKWPEQKCEHEEHYKEACSPKPNT